MKKILLTLVFFVAGLTAATAQDGLFDNARPGTPAVERADDGTLRLALPVALSLQNLSSSEALRFTPYLVSNADPTKKVALRPLILMGRHREIVTERMQDSKRPVPFLGGDPAQSFVLKRGEKAAYGYDAKVPFEEWMYDASLKVVAETWGCANCEERLEEKLLLTPVIDEPYEPRYTLAYITPPVEPVKARSDKHTATFNFVVARHELLRNYKNNAAEFAQVDQVVGDVTRNPDLTLTRLTIDGYASPEGRFESNRALAQRRADSFARYLEETFGISRGQFSVTGHGEDWAGLREAVDKSSISHRSEVLAVIDGVANPDARDARLKAIDRSVTYNLLLRDYYPPLRRTVYTLAYNVRSFTVEEGREIIKKNPKLLSLNEMYLVANSYPKGSKEFKEVFDIAVRLYPDQPIAIINAAAVEIEAGAYAAAIARLEKLPGEAAALNNLGVAYALSGDDAKAGDYFRRASAAGSPEAGHNADELAKKK